MIRFFLITLSLLMVKSSFCQKLNRYDKKGYRHGKWIVYNDSAKTKKSSEGVYKHGDMKGRFYFYTLDGVLERREITRFKRLKTTLYYPDGTVRFKGKARIDIHPDKIHYYFYGRWKYYTEEGKLEKYCYYKKGKLERTIYLDKNNKTNDSLIFALNEIDRRFQEKNAALLDSISQSKFILQREAFQMELYMTDTLTFHHIETILSHYGYPQKARAHDAAIIPFYIISFAPLGIKEKYLPELKRAADKGDLEWKALAFFIDKMKVAKGEKQVYGTQYYYKKRELVYYPTEDPEHLTERRAQVGL